VGPCSSALVGYLQDGNCLPARATNTIVSNCGIASSEYLETSKASTKANARPETKQAHLLVVEEVEHSYSGFPVSTVASCTMHVIQPFFEEIYRTRKDMER
jgi:hypothetical protein